MDAGSLTHASWSLHSCQGHAPLRGPEFRLFFLGGSAGFLLATSSSVEGRKPFWPRGLGLQTDRHFPICKMGPTPLAPLSVRAEGFVRSVSGWRRCCGYLVVPMVRPGLEVEPWPGVLAGGRSPLPTAGGLEAAGRGQKVGSGAPREGEGDGGRWGGNWAAGELWYLGSGDLPLHSAWLPLLPKPQPPPLAAPASPCCPLPAPLGAFARQQPPAAGEPLP